MKTIAVTGSSGFIGKHLLNVLKGVYKSVIELDIDKGFNLLLKKDVRRVPKFDVIIHLAAKSFVPQSFKIPWEYYLQNYTLTLNVLELARKNHAKVVFFSSYLYGTPDYLPINETHPIKPHNPYAQSKLICEKLCEGYNRDFNVPVIIYRPFNIYGPGQNSSFLIPNIIEQLKTGEILLKDPRPKRDFIYVTDVVKAVINAIEYDKTNFELFNLGYGKSYSVNEIVSTIQEVSRIRARVTFSNEVRQGEVLETVADISKLFAVFNWMPTTDFKEGIKKILS